MNSPLGRRGDREAEVTDQAFAASAKEFRAFLPVVNQVLKTMQVEPVS